MSEPPSPLEPRVLEALRDAPRPPAGARDRARARLFRPVPPPGESGPSSEGRASSAAPLGLGKWPLASLALLVGGAAGALLHAVWSQPSPPVVMYVDRPVTLAAPAPAPAPAPALSPSASQLAAERALLDEARAALVNADPDRALERLEKHRRTFSNPMLAEERDAMEVAALARAGRSAEARARAAAFQKRSPDSLFMSTVQSAIESIP